MEEKKKFIEVNFDMTHVSGTDGEQKIESRSLLFGEKKKMNSNEGTLLLLNTGVLSLLAPRSLFRCRMRVKNIPHRNNDFSRNRKSD